MKHAYIVLFGLTIGSVRADLNSGAVDSDTMSPEAEVFNGYTVAPLGLRGAIEPNGIERTFEGIIQDIEVQIRSIKADFLWVDFRPTKRSFPNLPRKRNLSKVLCHVQSLPPAPRSAVEASRDWLNSLATELSAPAQQCAQLSCTQGAAIWLCNDEVEWIQQNSITLADRVNAILNEPGCETNGDSGLVQGQAFDGAGWNVIVNGAQC
ncbi:hypothetical protein AAE478_006403 [Parahypoxylon ruwenzoriense]